MRATCLLLSCAPALLAQQLPDVFRFLPPGAAAVLRLQGPAAWRTELAGTGIAKVLASKPVGESLDEFLAAAGAALELDAAARGKLEAAWVHLGAHRGEIVVGAAVDLADLKPRQWPPTTVSLAIFGDGHTDLEALGKALAACLPTAVETNAPVETLPLHGHAVPLHRFGDWALTEPFLHEGTLLVLCGNDLPARAEQVLAPRPEPFVAAPELKRGVLGVQLDGKVSIAQLLAAAQNAPNRPDVPLAPLAELAGLLSFERLVYSMFADGKYLGQELGLEFGAQPRGGFDVVFPVRNTPPKLLRLLPPGTANFQAAQFDLEVLHGLFAQATALLGDELPMTREQIEATITEYTKLRLQEDLLALLGGEYLQIDDFQVQRREDGEAKDDDLREVGEAGSCIVVHLRDGAQLAKNVEKALRARGLHAGRKSEEYAGTKIYRLKLLGSLPVEYAFAGDVFVCAYGGEGTSQLLRRVLDAQVALAGGAAPAELHPKILARLDGLPADWSGLEAGEMVEVVDWMATSFEGIEAGLSGQGMTLADLDGVYHLVPGLLRALRDEVLRHGADVTVTATYSTKRRMSMRSRW